MDIPQDVLHKAAAGELEAFEALYRLSAGFVYNVALRIVNNREDAQEVAQEVFMIIHQKLKMFRYESSFKTWIYRITANTAINFAKGRARQRSVPLDEELLPAPEEAKEPDPQALDRYIGQLLNAVNPEQRACVVMRNIEGLSYKQIAEALNININTVRTRLKRAREKMLSLRKKVAHETV